YGLIDPIVDAERLLRVSAIHRRGRGVGNPGQVVDPPCSLQHHKRAGDIRVDIGIGIFQRIPYAGLRREMDDAAQVPVAFDCGEYSLAVGYVQLVEDKAREGTQLSEPRLLELYIIICV